MGEWSRGDTGEAGGVRGGMAGRGIWGAGGEGISKEKRKWRENIADITQVLGHLPFSKRESLDTSVSQIHSMPQLARYVCFPSARH